MRLRPGPCKSNRSPQGIRTPQMTHLARDKRESHARGARVWMSCVGGKRVDVDDVSRSCDLVKICNLGRVVFMASNLAQISLKTFETIPFSNTQRFLVSRFRY